MKSFQTLKGFVSGDEPQDLEPIFKYHATLRIFSEAGLDFEELAARIGAPTTSARRGERIGPRSPPRKGDTWMYRAPVNEEKELREHIDALWRVVEPNISFLRELKKLATVEVHLGYSSNIDHAGVDIPYGSLVMFAALEVDFRLHIIVLA